MSRTAPIDPAPTNPAPPPHVPTDPAPGAVTWAGSGPEAAATTAAGATAAPEDAVRTLTARRVAALADLAAATAAVTDVRALRIDRTDDDEHDPDGSPLSGEWSRVSARQRAAADRVAGIDAALTAVSAGRYGVCARCGRQIAPGRLEALPTATRCVSCADRR